MSIKFYDNIAYKLLKQMPLVHVAKTLANEKKDNTNEIDNVLRMNDDIHSTPINKIEDNTGIKILNAGYIRTNYDPNMSHVTGVNEELLFLFYGKAAYKDPNAMYTDIPLLPVAFILETDMTPDRIFPFDSGACVGFDPCKNKLYDRSRYHHVFGDKYRDKKLLKFKMPNDINKLGQYINSIWGNNRSYFNDSPAKMHKQIMLIDCQYIQDLIKLIMSDITIECDERKHTVEIQFSKSMPLEGNLIAVIVPNKLNNRVEFINAITPYLSKITLKITENDGSSHSNTTDLFKDKLEEFYENEDKKRLE